MHLRLFHKIFLLVALTALLAALAMAAVMSLNLRSGFDDYLDARDVESLEGVAAEYSQQLSAIASQRKLAPDDFEQLIAQNRPSDVRPPPPAQRPDVFPPSEPSTERRSPPGDRRPPLSFMPRLIYFDTSGQKISGPPLPRDHFPGKPIERRVEVADQLIGTIALLPRGPTPRDIDARFLQRQYIGAAVLTAILLVVAAIAALWIARGGARRLGAMQDATDAIAHGDFDTRIETSGSDEVAAMGNNINAMAESLEQLDTARRRWLAEIGHELRTPLAVLTGELDALKDGVRPINMEAVVSLSDETKLLNRLVDDLHFLAVSDLSGSICHFEPGDAVASLKGAVERFQQKAQDAGLTLVANTEPYESLPVNWDDGRIDQLLNALLTNSLRYTDAPGEIIVNLSVESENAMITINDSAPSVEARNFPHLFEPLYRVDDARSRQSGGSGLGLAVSQKIVEAHGGRISACASDIGGLSITVSIPLDKDQV
tara:strand:- start:2728 stop:4185 length:1458 start_codon:yes stop_codon:yes gene_type:complete